VEEETPTDLIIPTETTQEEQVTTEDHNRLLTTKVTIVIDMKVTQHGVQVVMDHSMETEVLVVDKVLS
tara:strand:+ start:312 stop:515 length:204 start_codon:yes stop_codon:yes gene_type:complete